MKTRKQKLADKDEKRSRYEEKKARRVALARELGVAESTPMPLLVRMAKWR